MKVFSIFPLVAVGTAFVLPDQEVMSSAAVRNDESTFDKAIELLPTVDELRDDVESAFESTFEKATEWLSTVDDRRDDVQDTVTEAFGCVKHHFSDAVDYTLDTVNDLGKSFEDTFDHDAWLESTEATLEDWFGPSERPRRPHHPPHHKKPNQTVYELIAKSKYTTTLAKLINDYPDLVEALNGTAANYTVFAPTDKAFEKIPKHAPKPSKEDLKKILTYHVSPEFYPAGRVLVTRTIPTLYKSPALGDEPQRISTQVSLRGLTANFYARIVAVDILGTNGVIHGLDSILVPPPKVIDTLEFLVGDFSTLVLALEKTGLAELMNDTSLHEGGTAFAPSNLAFKRLGPKINGFLFSKYGEKYLKALLEYHLVGNFTLYSDAFYNADEIESEDHHRIPKGRYHIDLPTALKGKSLAIDIARYGRLIEIKINGYNRVAVSDLAAKDGVIHVVNSVLIPPKKPGATSEVEENITVEELKTRLEPYIAQSETGTGSLEL